MKAKFRLWQSLKFRATVFTLAVFVLGICSLSLYTSRNLQVDMERLLGEQQMSVVTLVAKEVNDNLIQRLQALEAIAKKMDAAPMGSTFALQARLEQTPLLELLFNGGVWVADQDGTVIAEVPVSAQRIGLNYIDRDFVAATLKDAKSIISQPVMGRALLAPIFVMTVPLRDTQGTVIGVVAGIVNLGKPNFLDNLMRSPYGKTGGYLLISPKTRQIITATDKKRIMEVLPAAGINPYVDRNIAGYEGYSVLTNALGESQLASVKQVPAAGWYILLGTPTADAFAPLHHQRQQLFWAALFFTLMTGGLTWWVLSRQIAPLIHTSEAMAALGESQQIPQPLAQTHQGEIGHLVAGFNRILETWTQREAALKESEKNLAITLNSIGDGVIATNTAGCITSMNPTAQLLTGWTLADALGQPLIDVFHIVNSKTRLPSDDPVRLVLDKGEVVGLANHTTLLARDGHEYHIADSAAPIHNDAGDIVGVVLVFSDVTEKYRAGEALQRRQTMMERTENMARLASFEWDIDTNIVTWSPEMFRIFGRDPDLGVPNLEEQGQLYTPASTKSLLDVVNKAVSEGIPYKIELMTVQPDGEQRPCLVKGFPERDESGRVVRVAGLVQDITAIKAHQSQLERLAHFDALTNLPNRVLFADRLKRSMSQARRRGQQLAVAYLDLDGFKAINDRHGHNVGDQLLVTLSNSMNRTLREGDTLARMGGDEFVAVLIDLESPENCTPMLTRLLEAAAEPQQLGDLTLQISASLGVTFYPQTDDIDADQLLRQADQAMYQAKLAGKNRLNVFDAAQDFSIRGRNEKLQRIRQALAQDEFVLYYQPKVNMRTGNVIGAEALIRWQHPDDGLLPPAEFLPVIEDHQLAVEVGEWVIATAITQMERWQASGLDLHVSVNIGARQLQQGNLVAFMESILAKHPQVHPGCLELEVLETSALADMDRVSQVIDDCAKMGVRFALDDFGTGYSSLTYLKRLHVALLKIDQSFVRDMLEDPDDLAILEGVIGLAAAFKREVIAEGVESVAHGTLLLQLGCELAQGYGIARPMPAAEMPAWVATWQPDPAWSKLSFGTSET